MKFRHKKRGSTYEVVTVLAKVQIAPETLQRLIGAAGPHELIAEALEKATFVVYTDGKAGVYVREHDEFFDGRFEVVE